MNKGVKKAPFVVLIGADVPSLLDRSLFHNESQRGEKTEKRKLT